MSAAEQAALETRTAAYTDLAGAAADLMEIRRRGTAEQIRAATAVRDAARARLLALPRVSL